MRRAFPGFYNLSDKEIAEVCEKCLFVIDANVLLNLYRYPDDARKKLIDTFSLISDRLWIPNQAAYEFLDQCSNALSKQKEAYSDLEKYLNATKEDLEKHMKGFSKQTLIETKEWQQSINNQFSEIKTKLSQYKQHQRLTNDNDKIKEEITKLLNNKVGAPYRKSELEMIFSDGKIRYDSDIPPGYNDKTKIGIKKYSDLVIWHQIMDKAKELKKPIVLITNDNKSDWCVKVSETKIYPRPELINEIFCYAHVKFHLFNTSCFMEWADNRFQLNINNQVEEVRKIDAQSNFGTVTGRVMRRSSLTNGEDIGIGGADVSIIDTSINKEIYKTMADSMGYYQFNNVKSTNGQLLYQIYAKLSLIGECRTSNFSLNPSETKMIAAYLKL